MILGNPRWQKAYVYAEALTRCDYVRLVDLKPRKGAEGLNIAFLHPRSTQGVLTELCEKILTP